MFKQFSRNGTSPANPVVALAGGTDVIPAVYDKPSAEEAELIARLDLKSRLHEVLLERLNLSVIDKVQPEELRREVATLVSQV
ncbi:CpaF family protein, partial [Thioclava sp. BHET1]